jgi:hypothetical protein
MPSRHAPVLAAASLVAVLFLLSLTLRPVHADVYYLALLLTGLTLLPLVIRAASGTLDLFEPIVPISLLIGLTYSLRAIYIGYAAPRDVSFGRLSYSDQVAGALALTIAAYGALLAGYYVLAGPLRIKPLSTWRFAWRNWAPVADAVKIAILLGISIYGVRMSGATDFEVVTNTTTLIGLAASGVQLTGCILALHMAAGDTRLWVKLALWGIVLPLAVWLSLALGSKAQLLLFVYAAVAARHYVKQRTPLGVALIVAIVAVLTVFPTINVFRDTGAPNDSVLTRIADVPNRFAGMTAREYVGFAAENVLSRSNGIDALALVMKYDVSAELGNPSAYAAIPFYAFIPRAIWPDKPVINQGARFGQLVLVGGLEGKESLTSFGMFHIGDLYVSFGPVGVLIGMLALGCLYRLVYKFFDPLHTPNLGIKFLYILVLWSMVNGFESDVPTVYSNLLKFLPIWIAVTIWMTPRGGNFALRRRSASTANRPEPPSQPIPIAPSSAAMSHRAHNR